MLAQLQQLGLETNVINFASVVSGYSSKLSSEYRSRTAMCTDDRVRFMDEIISGIQVIKMYAWERPFTHMIALGRRLELKYVRRSSYVRALYMTFMLFTTRMAMFCTMVAIVLLYGRSQLTVAKIFTVSAYFNVISIAMSQMFVRGLSEVAEGLVAFKRLQEFLNVEERTIAAIDDRKAGSCDSIDEEVLCGTKIPPDPSFIQT